MARKERELTVAAGSVAVVSVFFNWRKTSVMVVLVQGTEETEGTERIEKVRLAIAFCELMKNEKMKTKTQKQASTGRQVGKREMRSAW